MSHLLDRSPHLDTALAHFPLPCKGKRDSFPNSTESLHVNDIYDTLLHFFVRASSKTLVLHAPSDSTVGSIIARISFNTRVTSTDHRLVYRNRVLSEDSTLADCAIERDATLYLTCRPGSSRFPRAWRVLDEMLSAIRGILALGNPDGKGIPCINSLVKEFLAMAPEVKEDVDGHLQVFISAKAHVALVKLYLSEYEQIRQVAREAIILFFNWDSSYISILACRHCTPILFEFCKVLAGTVRRMDSLYIFCRSVLGLLLVSEDREFYLSRKRGFINELYPFFAELCKASIMLPSGRSIFLASYGVLDLSNFFKAMRRVIREWLGGDVYVQQLMYNSSLHMCEEWATVLHAVVKKLLKMFDQGLKNVGKFMVQNTAAEIDSHSVHWDKILALVVDFVKFAETYEDAGELLHAILLARKVSLNALIKHARGMENYHWLLKLKDITDFEARKKLLVMLFRDRNSNFEEPHEMLIDRSDLLTESFRYIGQVDANALRGELFLEFNNEEATGPGVLREWFRLVCQVIFSPQNVLFLSCPNNPRRFFPNPGSVVDPLHLKYFSFVGRVIALALMHEIQVGITFDHAFFLQLSGKTITLEDIQDADPFLYMSCKKILEMDDEIVDSDALGLTFVRETEVPGSQRAVELCPGGMKIAVNSRNRKEYVALLIQNRFVTSTAEQIHHFSEGFSEILLERRWKMFVFQGLDLEDFNQMLGGSDDAINVNEWKAHTTYDGYNEKDCQINWFWKV